MITEIKPLPEVRKHFGKRKHSLQVCHYYAERKIACPYCTKDSEPVPMAEIIGDLERVNARVYVNQYTKEKK